MTKRKDVLLSATNAIDQILSMLNVIEKHKKEMLSDMIFKITEVDGKSSPPYLSKKVYKIRLAENEKNAGLVQDHVFTRKGLIQKLLKNPTRSKYILKNAISCTVTKEEHNKLSAIKNADGWKRYKKAGIKVYSKQSKSWII
ncbi:MAG: hypothetical protein Q7S09_03080 [bacterium]|nr:hypothetical protein [bacterium]